MKTPVVTVLPPSLAASAPLGTPAPTTSAPAAPRPSVAPTNMREATRAIDPGLLAATFNGAPAGSTTAHVAHGASSATTYKLTGASLAVRGAPADAADIEAWLRENLTPRVSDVAVEPIVGGFSKRQIFSVRVGGEPVGAVMIFANGEDATRWSRGVELLARTPSLRPPQPFGAFTVTSPNGTTEGAFVEYIERPTIAYAVRTLPPDGSARRCALAEVERHLRDTASGLGELHRTFDRGECLSPKTLDDWCSRVRSNIERAASRWPGHATGLARLASAAEQHLFDRVRGSALRATVVHGDATLRNFCPSEGCVRVFDTDDLARAYDDPGGCYTPAMDLGRLVQHMQTLSNGKRQTSLAPHEHEALSRAFLTAYGATEDSLGAPLLLARIQYQVAALNHARNDHEAQLAMERVTELTDRATSSA